MVTTGKVAAKLTAELKNTNGVDAKTGSEKNVASPEAAESKDPVIIPSITAEKKTDVVILSLQDRLKKIETLNLLIERRTLLTDALDDVNAFVITSTTAPSLRFQDGGSRGFSISNHAVIADMVQLAKDKLLEEIAKIDVQIVF